MTISKERLESARTFVANVLAGQITPETEPMLFEEDIVLFNVRTLEKGDPTWVLTQLADPSHPLSGRVEVLNNLRDLFDAGYAILNPGASDLG
jgi:hypothetical protein